MDPEYGRRYRELHRRHWWWRARERVILDVVGELQPPGGFGHILDVGCGDGLLFPALAPLGEVEGIEPDEGLVSRAATPDGVIHVRPFDASFRPGRAYGLMLMLDVLEHMDAPDEAAAHARELLEPGGSLVVTVPAFRSLWTQHDVLNEHRTRYSRAEIVRLLRDAGLEVGRARYLFRWLVPAKVAVRAKEAVLGGEPRPPTLPPAPLNRILYGLTRMEEGLLGRVPLPFGTSVLAVARRPIGA
ncbi:MAG: class I SAM-dependent methyltransferase [Gemmatimonadetes bacterium]|nr:class I SAM-dependent methyltransferase [Gemmatimonadota bacterium]